MRHDSNIKKWAELKGLAAVAIDTGKKIGTIEDFYFETNTGNIYAFKLKTGLLGHIALRTEHLRSIGVDAVTFDSEADLVKEEKGSHLATLPLGSELQQFRVLTEGGKLVGEIGNVLIDMSDPSRLRVGGFQMAGGLREKLSKHYDTFKVNQVISYGHDVIVIPDTIAETFH